MSIVLDKLYPDYFPMPPAKPSEIWQKPIAINTGEFINIVAPSGSGKTSLIHFIYGLRDDFKGSIQLDHETLNGCSKEKLAEIRSHQLSIVFQDLRLFPNLTVLENIEIKRQLQPYHSKEKIKEMAQRLGIENKLGQLARHCSYGEQQRVAIIRAMMQPYDFLLLDEPFSHLDKANAKMAMELIQEEALGRKAGIIFADLEAIDLIPFHKTYFL